VGFNDVVGSRQAQSLAIQHARNAGGGFLLLGARRFASGQAHSQQSET